MATAPDAPADTTMMRVVHDALRRDLTRATVALTSPDATPDRWRAVGAHLGWMMRFLRAHHAAEDDGLYPLVRERAGGAPDLQAVLDRMARQHEELTPAITAVQGAGATLFDHPSDGAARQAAAAIEALEALLLPHLRKEEDEAMPITSTLLTAAEWDAIEKVHNVDPKSMPELGFEGHWLIDSASEADRATVVGLVPPLPRFILLHGFAGRYRRHLRACWGDVAERRRPRRVQTSNSVTVTVDADIDMVWDVARDVTRVGEWSHECIGAAWLGEARSAAPGARFRGRNRAGLFRWGRVCEITSAVPYELTWRTVPTLLYPDSSEWTIALHKVEGGTRIVQGFRVLRAPKVLSVVYATLIPAHRDRTAALVADLERLGDVARLV